MALLHNLPLGYSLFIATPQKLHLRAQSGGSVVFECETANGVVNAKASRDNSSLVAIADSHVVILYDTARGGDRKYELKKGDGEPSLLLFSPDSRILYFTTTLSTSVQAYSIPTAELLPTLPPHPSPPNTLSISTNGDILLSASPTPPTVYLQDLRWGGSAPVNFQSTDARSPITCAAFHSLEGSSQILYTNFVLGFQDGALAMYRLFLPHPTKHRKASYAHHTQAQAFQLQPIRVGAIRKLHKAAMGGITVARFLPGYKSRVVSIGHDGRCRLMDFENATSLSILSNGPLSSRGRPENEVMLGGDATEELRKIYEGSETLIAIGTHAGKVLVFNVLGLLIHEVCYGCTGHHCRMGW
ncbi:WD40 repeat-like protein [Plenodomus tracheiphilus IPT5]|uniref:WD40 repeat-like protein n=1 Tax=Plenodomus tracheiphilus IPT5 TaxID=1408161 RepID=A0A6A7APH8_9PLEO|nr:WD40 repeat-like protein [Plenodomus tracheiphilus IPT5]